MKDGGDFDGDALPAVGVDRSGAAVNAWKPARALAADDASRAGMPRAGRTLRHGTGGALDGRRDFDGNALAAAGVDRSGAAANARKPARAVAAEARAGMPRARFILKFTRKVISSKNVSQS